MKRFLARNRKLIIGILFSMVFSITLVFNIPSWALSNVIEKYSQGRLKLYNTEGTFWDGSGLLVALSSNRLNSAPLIMLKWKIRLGFHKFVDIQFSVGNKQIADVFYDKRGANLDKLNLSLSITQVEQLFDVVKDLNVSGNINLSTDHILLGNKMVGDFKVNLDNISSGISRVNPLGSYVVTLSAADGHISMTSSPNSILLLSGEGSTVGLTLSARISAEHREEMLQFITLMGIPKPDGSYMMKIF